jgi:formyl-CoA transferase
MTEKHLPLQNITVIDCASLIAGPLAATYLGDFGADVIKIEHPGYGDAIRGFGREDQELSWKWMGRNKRSVAVDLHETEGQEAFKELVTDADVLIESFRPGKLEEWGIGWDTLSDINPELVMVRTSGFGQTGPHSDRPGFGTLAEAMSGFAHATGFPDKPPTLPALGLADSITACHSAFAAMFALYWRDVEGGSGQYIDSSVLEPLFGIMGRRTVAYSENGEVHERQGNRSAYTAPRNTYRTKDDQWVAISGSSENIANRVLQIVGGEEMKNDPRFETNEKRIENVEELDEIIQAWMSERTREEIIEEFDRHNAAIAPVYDIEDIFQDPHFEERDALITVEDDEYGEITMNGVFPKLSETPGRVNHAGPSLGESTISVLSKRTSFDEKEIRDLAGDGVFGVED